MVGGSIVDIDAQDWDQVLAINVRGVFLTLQAFARTVISRGDTGAAVLIGSVNGQVADPWTAAYSCSKAAVMHLARVSARELGAYGIRVNAVGPGPTDTPLMAETKKNAGYWEAIEADTPLGQIGQSE